MKTIATSLFCTALALVLSPAASAVTVDHETDVNAAGVCVSAFSNQVVRNRPTGVRNTGTAAIYVTCSAPGYFNNSVNYQTWIRVANFGLSTQQINCNLQTGWTNGVTNTTVQGSHSKGASVAANGYQWLTFYNTDYALTSFYNVNVVCLLPPQTELQYIGWQAHDEVGA